MEIPNTREIDRAISSLSEHARWLDARYQSDRRKLSKSLKILEDARQVFDDPPARRGYVTNLIPIMQTKGGVMKLTEMLAELRKVEGFRRVTLESLEATLSSELRNLYPRLQRVGPRVYALARSKDVALTPVAA